jgi:hypothetical protein
MVQRLKTRTHPQTTSLLKQRGGFNVLKFKFFPLFMKPFLYTHLPVIESDFWIDIPHFSVIPIPVGNKDFCRSEALSGA